jgi:hypothetical protein
MRRDEADGGDRRIAVSVRVVDDDDDWTGTPPEGHHSRDRARPDFWRRQWQASVAGGVLVLVIVGAIVLLLLR